MHAIVARLLGSFFSGRRGLLAAPAHAGVTRGGRSPSAVALGTRDRSGRRGRDCSCWSGHPAPAVASQRPLTDGCGPSTVDRSRRTSLTIAFFGRLRQEADHERARNRCRCALAVSSLAGSRPRRRAEVDFILNWVPAAITRRTTTPRRWAGTAQKGIDLHLEPGKGSALR